MPNIKTPPETGNITTTTGTGAYSLGGALTVEDGGTLHTFSQALGYGWISDGDQIYYVCKNGDNPPALEWGIGTYNHVAQTLARTSIGGSTSGGAAVTWGAGDKSLFAAYPPEQVLLAANNLSEVSVTALGLDLIQQGTEADARGVIGLGTAATKNTGTTNGTVPLWENIPTGPIPAGTVMLFYQAAAPTGWTRVTTVNDKVPIIVSAGSPGTTNAETWIISGLAAGGTALSTAELPSHTHDIKHFFTSSGVAFGGGPAVVEVIGFSGPSSQPTEATGSGDAHDHAVTSTGAWRPPGAYFLIASKN